MTAKYATGESVFGKLVKDPHFWAPAVAMGAGVAATGAAAAVKKLTDARAQARSFKEMQDIHPALKTRDQTLVKRIYSSLHNVNPMMARDPMVAGAWVDTIIESGGLDQGAAARALLEGVKDLAQIRSHISGAARHENSAPKMFGEAVRKQVETGFDRTREYGELATAHKQIKDIQERHEAGKQQMVARDMTKAFTEATKRLSQTSVTPGQQQQIIDAIASKYSSATKTPGQRLIEACTR